VAPLSTLIFRLICRVVFRSRETVTPLKSKDKNLNLFSTRDVLVGNELNRLKRCVGNVDALDPF